MRRSLVLTVILAASTAYVQAAPQTRPPRSGPADAGTALAETGASRDAGVEPPPGDQPESDEAAHQKIINALSIGRKCICGKSDPKPFACEFSVVGGLRFDIYFPVEHNETISILSVGDGDAWTFEVDPQAGCILVGPGKRPAPGISARFTAAINFHDAQVYGGMEQCAIAATQTSLPPSSCRIVEP